jgi:Leucine-rich repeat (LRR) protein
VIALVALVVVQVIFVWMTVIWQYQQEQKIARHIAAIGGDVWTSYYGPNWFPGSWRRTFPYFNRIDYVGFGTHNNRPWVNIVPENLTVELGSLRELRELNLGDNHLSELVHWSSHGRGFTNLYSLSINGTAVTNAEIKRIADLTNLTDLSLRDAEIDDSGVEQLKRLINLRSLKIRNSHVTDAGLKHLAELKHLERLDLERSQITDKGLEYLKSLKNLDSIWLNDTSISDAGVEHLTGLKALTYVGLGGTQISDTGLERLVTLVGLQGLSLQYTQVTDAGLESLKTLSKLKFIELDDTQATDEWRAMLRANRPAGTVWPILPGRQNERVEQSKGEQ